MNDTPTGSPQQPPRLGRPKGGASSSAPVRPTAGPARPKSRHRGLLFSMLAVIVLPVLITTVYLLAFARDQYASTVGFTIRHEETSGASELMGGISSMLGAGTRGEADLLYEFIQSQEIIERISTKFDLVGHYSANWPYDPVYSLWPDATIEDILWFWERMVRISYDKSSGLIQVQVRANDPQSAQKIARLIVSESELMINRLNLIARTDATRNAESDLKIALERLRTARQALAAFRASSRIVDPQADIAGRMGVLSNLQQQLATALVEYDLLIQTADPSDPRLALLQRRIEVVRARIRDERQSLTQQGTTDDGTDYPQLIAQFESLQVDQAFAETTYQAALTALDAARSNAERQNLYLANFIQPTYAQQAEYPKTTLLILLTLLFASLFWGVLALVYYSLRDRG